MRSWALEPAFAFLDQDIVSQACALPRTRSLGRLMTRVSRHQDAGTGMLSPSAAARIRQPPTCIGKGEAMKAQLRAGVVAAFARAAFNLAQPLYIAI